MTNENVQQSLPRLTKGYAGLCLVGWGRRGRAGSSLLLGVVFG